MPPIASFDFSSLSTTLTAVLGAGGIGGVVVAVIGYLKWKHERAEVVRLSGAVGGLQQQLDTVKKDKDDVSTELNAEKEAHAATTTQVDTLSADILRLQTDVEKRDTSLRRQGNLSKKMLGMEGEFWRARANKKQPRFIPIADRGERKTVIFSVLNLKGGVGKTTLTANLGAALTAMGRNVLFVDTDLQGSLTSLLLPFDKIGALRDDERLLQDFLTRTTAPGPVNLLPYTLPAFDGSQSRIVPTEDHLAYADMNLMVTWMLRLAKRDSRFLLRRGLHQKRIFSKFDVVLIDCPPLLSTCCINALAASDFVLIPVTPSENAADRVPQLIHTLKHSIASLNPHLAVGGLIYNQSRRAILSEAESVIWQSVQKRAGDQLGTPVRAFTTLVRHMPDIRDTEVDFEQPKAGSERFDVFRSLAEELLEVVPSASNQVS